MPSHAATLPLPRRQHLARLAGRVRFAACILTACLLAAGTASAQLAVHAPTGPLEASGGTTTTLVFTLTNRSDTTFSGTPRVQLPRGWQAVLPPESVRVPPGGQAVIIEPVHVPPRAAAGDYRVVLSVAQPILNATATVTVPTHRQLAITLTRDVPQTAQPTYALRFRITNRGNVAEDLALSATTTAGSTVTLDRADAHLNAGAAATVTATVTPPHNLTHSTQEAVRLLASDAQAGTPLASATATTELLTVHQPAMLAYHTIPFRVTLGTRLDNTVPAQPAEALPNTHVSVDGSGALQEGGDTTLTVHLDNTLDGSWHQDRVALTTPTFAVALGDLTLDGLDVLPEDPGFGVSAHGNLTEDATIGAGIVYANDGTLHARVTYQLQPMPGLSVATTAVLQGDTPAVAVATHGRAALRNLNLDAGFSAAITRTVDGAPTAKLASDLTATGPHGALRATVNASGRDFLSAAPASLNVRVSASQAEPQGTERPLMLESSYTYAVTYPAAIFTGTPLTSKSHVTLSATGKVGDTQLLATLSHLSLVDRINPASDAHFSRVTFAAALRTNRGARLYPELGITWGQRHTTQGAPISDPALTVGAHATFPLGNGAVYPAASASLDLTTGALVDGGARLTWSGTIAPHASAGASLQYQLANHALDGHAFLHLGGAHDTDWHFDAALASSTSTALQASLTAAVSVPVNVPTSRRANISTVQGRILDASGHGVPHLVVQLAGYAAMTDATGTYHFAAIPKGQHELSLQSTLPVGMGTQPQFPLSLTIEHSTTTVPDVQIVKLATLTGQIHVRAPQQAIDALYGTTDGGIPSLAGIPFELRSGTDTIYVEADQNGSFKQMLPPGRWTMSALTDALPPHWTLTPSTTTIELPPGQDLTANFTLTGAKRTIHFTNGGSLGLHVSPPSSSAASDAR